MEDIEVRNGKAFDSEMRRWQASYEVPGKEKAAEKSMGKIGKTEEKAGFDDYFFVFYLTLFSFNMILYNFI